MPQIKLTPGAYATPEQRQTAARRRLLGMIKDRAPGVLKSLSRAPLKAFREAGLDRVPRDYLMEGAKLPDDHFKARYPPMLKVRATIRRWARNQGVERWDGIVEIALSTLWHWAAYPALHPPGVNWVFIHRPPGVATERFVITWQPSAGGEPQQYMLHWDLDRDTEADLRRKFAVAVDALIASVRE